MMNPKLNPYIAVFIGLSGLILGEPAAAYLGPGAGLGMIGSLIAIVVVGLIMVLGLVIYPIKLLRKRRRDRSTADKSASE